MTQPSVKADTEYVVLRLVPPESSTSPTLWEIVDEDVPARDAEHAVKKAAAGLLRNAGDKGSFVAVPSRSWKPITLAAKIETTLEVKNDG